MQTFEEVVKASGLCDAIRALAVKLGMSVSDVLDNLRASMLREQAESRTCGGSAVQAVIDSDADTDDNDTEVPGSTEPVDPTHYN